MKNDLSTLWDLFKASIDVAAKGWAPLIALGFMPLFLLLMLFSVLNTVVFMLRRLLDGIGGRIDEAVWKRKQTSRPTT